MECIKCGGMIFSTATSTCSYHNGFLQQPNPHHWPPHVPESIGEDNRHVSVLEVWTGMMEETNTMILVTTTAMTMVMTMVMITATTIDA